MLKIIEAIQSWLGHIAENNAGALEAITEQAIAQGVLVSKLERLEDAVATLVGKVGQMHDSIDDLNKRLGAYLTDQAKKDVSLRQLKANQASLESEVREIKRVATGG